MKGILIWFFFLLLPTMASSQSGHRYGFVENKGQVIDQFGKQNSDVKYILSNPGVMNIQLHQNGFSYDVFERINDPLSADEKRSDQFVFHRTDVIFEGCNEQVEIIAADEEIDYLNFYTTGIKNNSAYQTHHFKTVRYKNIYPGIDIVFYTDPQNGSLFKYDFILAPGADPGLIKLNYSGHDQFHFSGDLLQFNSGNCNLTEKIPASWWIENSEPATVKYKATSQINNQVVIGFELNSTDYSKTNSLVIDPLPDLDWATYYGDTLHDVGTGVITDNWGHIYATGFTQSFVNLATSGVHQDTLAGGMYDVYITKFNQYGQREWSTYYGGTGWEESASIIVDTLFNVSVTGFTDSPNGIASDSAYQQTHNGGIYDAFIAKFNTNGLRLWSTYFGGEGDDKGKGIDTDFDGLVWVCGSTLNSTFGIASTSAFQSNSSGQQDAFVVKFNAGGLLIWSTYFGGSGNDDGLSISEELGSVYISGKTNSSDLVTSAGAWQQTAGGNADAYITSFYPDGNLKWSTYFGGAEDDQGNDIEIFNTKIYIVGQTKSLTQIADVGAWSENLNGTQDAFITRFDTTGVKIWSTYFGKTEADNAVGVSIELDGGIYFTGVTFSDSLATADAYDTTFSNNADVYVSRFFENGLFDWCSYYGGSGTDSVAGIDVYGNTSIYLTGFTNSTDSISSVISSFQDNFAGGSQDAFIAKFITEKSTIPHAGTCLGGGSGGGGGTCINCFCEGDTITIGLLGGSLGIGANWVWYQDGCGVLGTQIYIGDTLVVAPPLGVTTYYVRAESINNATDCISFSVEVYTIPVAVAQLTDSLCPGTTLQLTGSGGLNYAWSGPNGFSSPLQNPQIDSLTQLNAGNYILTVDNDVCLDTDTTSLYIHPDMSISFVTTNPVCVDGTNGTATVVSTGVFPYSYAWSPIPGVDSTLISLSEGVYYVTVTDSNLCAFTDSVLITNPAGFLIGTNSTSTFCNSPTGTAEILTSGIGSPYYYDWSTGDTTSLITAVFPGWITVIVTNSSGCFESDSIYVDSLNNLDIMAQVIQNETCAGNSDGIAEVLINSGAAPFVYTWFASGGTNAIADSLSPNQYLITVTDTNNCLRTDTIIILPATPISLLSQNLINPTCGFFNGSIEVNATGGIGVLNYTWYPTNQTGSLANNLDSGVYTMLVTDENGCKIALDFSLTQTGIFSTALFAETNFIHEGDSIELIVENDPQNGIYSYFWIPEIYCLDCSSVYVSPVQNENFTVLVTNENGCTDTATILISVIPCIDPFLPTIFSPNEDGLNDTWGIFGSCIEEVNLRVFDRWGEELFFTADQAQAWDGTYKGQPVPAGNYTYQSIIRLKDNSAISDSGTITIVR